MKWSVLLSLCLGIVSCEDSGRKWSATQQKPDEYAWHLIQKNCQSCHASVTQEIQIAPSWQEIQHIYISYFKDRSEAQSGIVSFVQNPSKDKAIMKKAVSKYGLMPSVRMGRSEIEAMTKYILEHDLSSGSQITSSHITADSLEETREKDEIVNLARDISMKSQNYLGSQLMGAISSGGISYAVEFCHMKASFIIDSLAQVYDAEISRKTDKARNPAHKATTDEIAYMEEVRKMNSEERKQTFRKVETDSGAVCYFPILTRDMCLSCHGQPRQDIEINTLEIIETLYPEDKALGYRQGDVRGLFKVYFRNKNGR